MRRAYVIGLAGLLVCAAGGLADEKQPGAEAYQPPEGFVSSGDANDYLAQARKFLEQNSDDARAPRVAMDMLVFATAMQDQAGIEEAKARLLFQFGDTLSAAYLIRASKPDELCTLLKSAFTSAQEPHDKDSLK